MMRRTNLLVGSRYVQPMSGDGMIEVVSPITEQVIGVVPPTSTTDVDMAAAAASHAFEEGPWPRMGVRERGTYITRLLDLLRPKLDAAVKLQIDEMGSPYVFMHPTTHRFFGIIGSQIDQIAAINTREVRNGPVGQVLVSRNPVGVVAVVIPWNAPFISTLDALVTPLLIGCPVIVKPPLETPLSPYLIADAVAEAGFPDGVVSILHGGADIGERLVAHPAVRHVILTGSSATGARVGAICGEGLKSATLELGGKSAAIILPDADLDRYLPTLIGAAIPNNGQVCLSTSRILIPRQRAKDIADRIITTIGAMKIGNPHEHDTQFGPLVSARQRDRVEGYIRSGSEQGARLLLGGGRPAHLPVGYYVEPTIFTDVDPGARIAQEEIFGPVLCLFEYETEDEAVALANNSDYGLGGAVYTQDIDHGLAVARRIRTGTCSINDAPMGGGGGPFGGVKRSGLGRKRGREGYEQYFEIQSIALPAGYQCSV